MYQLLTDDVWNGVNAICQMIIAVEAIIALAITIMQIGSKSRVKLHMSLGFRLNHTKLGENMKMTVEICLNIANMGIAPVYITSCGIDLFDGKAPKSVMPIEKEMFSLESGQCISITSPYFSLWFPEMKEKASLRDKIRIFAVCGTGKTYFKKYNYADFQHEYQKYVERLEESEK